MKYSFKAVNAEACSVFLPGSLTPVGRPRVVYLFHYLWSCWTLQSSKLKGHSNLQRSKTNMYKQTKRAFLSESAVHRGRHSAIIGVHGDRAQKKVSRHRGHVDLLLEVNHLYCGMKGNGNKWSVRNEKRLRTFKAAHFCWFWNISAELK